jgi:nucleoside-diphosphate-sugar epimerase
MQNRILVTGATGVLGKAIVQAAVDAGLPVARGFAIRRRRIRT